MTRPIEKKSLHEAAAAADGDSLRTLGHKEIGLFVVAQNLDSANDTLAVRVEGAVRTENGKVWAPMGDSEDITADGFSDRGEGVFAAYTKYRGLAINEVRAAVTDFSDGSGDGDLSVDAFILLNGDAGAAAQSYEQDNEYAEDFN